MSENKTGYPKKKKNLTWRQRKSNNKSSIPDELKKFIFTILNRFGMTNISERSLPTNIVKNKITQHVLGKAMHIK